MSYCYFYYLAWGPGLGGSRQGNQEPSLTFEPTVLEFIIRGYDLKRQGTAFLSSLSFPTWKLRRLICLEALRGMEKEARRV